MAERPWGFESPLAHSAGEVFVERRGHRPARKARRQNRQPGKHRRRRVLPPWLTMLGSILVLLLIFAFIIFVARGCIANQQATQVRKYVTTSDSILTDSASTGNRDLESILQKAGGNPAKINQKALKRVANHSQSLYQRTLDDEAVPKEFKEAHHYMESALGIRATATENLEQAASGDASGFRQQLSRSVASYRLSDAIIAEHYIPATKDALEKSGQLDEDRSNLYQPRPFMDYSALGFKVSSSASSYASESNPNVLHGVEVSGVKIGGQTLYQGGNVTLTGSETPVFGVTVTNGGDATETNVPVEVVMNTKAERQSQAATIQEMKPKRSATVKIKGFSPGELNESAKVSVKVGPVKYEKYTRNNTLTGTVTFGM